MKYIANKDYFYIKYLGLFFVSAGAVTLLLTILKVSTATYQLVTDQIALLGILLVACAGRKKYFLIDIKKINWPVLAFSLLLGLAISLITRWLQIKLLELGYIIMPGASQITIADMVAVNTDYYAVLVSVILLGPLMEELLFRFIGLGLVNQTVIDNIENRRFRILLFVSWSVVLSSLFALLHRPDLSAFPFYFGSSIIYCLVFNKYGFFASLLAHSATNAGSALMFLWSW